MGVHRRPARVRRRLRRRRRRRVVRRARQRARGAGRLRRAAGAVRARAARHTFTEPAERGKAFGIFGAIAGGGSAIGLLLGGILTEGLNWRWCLYVNLLFAVPAAIAALRLIENVAHPRGRGSTSRAPHWPPRGCSRSSTASRTPRSHSWGHPLTIVALALAVVLLSTFVLVESRVAHPLLPLRVIADRMRGGSYLAIGISGIALFAVFLFLTYYLQQTKGFSPIETGLAYLPMTAAIMITATSANIKLPRQDRAAAAARVRHDARRDGDGVVRAARDDFELRRHVLPGLIVLGIGMGNIFAPAISSATYGVDPADTGVASAMVNTMQQVGGSIGTALLSSIFASAVTSYAEGSRRGRSSPPTPRCTGTPSRSGSRGACSPSARSWSAR